MVEDGGQHFTGNLVHVGNHQEEALGGGEGAGEGTALEGAVYGAGGTGLALHLRHFNGLAPEVLLPMGGPLVDVLGHRGGRGDGVDGGMLAEQISNVRRCIVTIAGDEFLFVCHNRTNVVNMFCLLYSVNLYHLGAECFGGEHPFLR